MSRKIVWRKIVVLALVLAVPASASAGPLREAVEKAGRELGVAQADQSTRGRGRFWMGIALIAAGGTLAAFGGIELGDSDTGPDEDNDTDDVAGADDGDSGEKAMLGGGIAAAGVGILLLMTGGRASSPTVSARPGRVAVSHTVRF